MKKIDLEAHFFTEEYEAFMLARKDFPKFERFEDENKQQFVRLLYSPDLYAQNTLHLHKKFMDLGENRLKDMDEAGIDMQVLSLMLPGCEQFDPSDGIALAKTINDKLSKAVKKHPDRFIGVAALAPQDPEGSANELERAVVELGLSGANVNSHVRGSYLDEKKYWPIFEVAAKHEVPILIHPNIPSPAMLQPYADYGYSLAGPSLGFAAETALHAMRLILSGVFDTYPNLKFILGHLGEALPFWLSRMDFFWDKQTHKSGHGTTLLKKPSDYFKDNFTVSISGMFFYPAFLCTYLALGADRMAFAVDYPFEQNEHAEKFVEALTICDTDKHKICHQNAERLFKITS